MNITDVQREIHDMGFRAARNDRCALTHGGRRCSGAPATATDLHTWRLRCVMTVLTKPCSVSSDTLQGVAAQPAARARSYNKLRPIPVAEGGDRRHESRFDATALEAAATLKCLANSISTSRSSGRNPQSMTRGDAIDAIASTCGPERPQKLDRSARPLLRRAGVSPFVCSSSVTNYPLRCSLWFSATHRAHLVGRDDGRLFFEWHGSV